MSYSFNVPAPVRTGLGSGWADALTTPVVPKKPTAILEYGGPTGYPTYDWVYHSELNRWVWQKAVTAVRTVQQANVFPPPPPPVTILPGVSNIPNTVTLPAAAQAMNLQPSGSVPVGATVSTGPLSPITSTPPTPVIDTSTGVQVGTVTGMTVTGTPVVTPTGATPVQSDITGAAPSTTPDWITAGVWVLGGFILWSTFRGKGGSTKRRRRRRV